MAKKLETLNDTSRVDNKERISTGTHCKNEDGLAREWSLKLFYLCYIVGLILASTAGLFRDNIYHFTGAEVNDPATQINIIQIYLFKLLYEGMIPYFMLGIFLGGLFYAIMGKMCGLFPNSSNAKKDFAIFQKYLNTGGPTSKSLKWMGIEADISRKGRLMRRLEVLSASYDIANNRQMLSDENDRLTALDDSTASYCLLPLEYAVWMLPILGFIGTVVGVTEAVGGLRLAIIEVFTTQALGAGVLAQFMVAFNGLVLAFDTTLFGLLGLALIGTIQFVLTKTSSLAVLGVGANANQAINLLESEDDILELLKKWQEGLFEEDEQGKLVSHHVKHFKKVIDALYDKEQDSEEPVSMISDIKTSIQQGLFSTGENDEGKAPLLSMINNMLQSELYFTDSNGQPAGSRIRQLLGTLMQAFYVIAPEDAENYATEGTNEITGETIKLNLRSEVQFAQIKMFISAIMYTLQCYANNSQSGNSKGSGTIHPTTQNVEALPANQRPIQQLSISGNEYVAVRESAAIAGRYEMLTGRLEMIGTMCLPQAGPTQNVPVTPINTLTSNETKIVILSPTDLCKYDSIEDNLPNTIANFSSIDKKFSPGKTLAIFPYNNIVQVIMYFSKDDGTRNCIMAFPLDGSTFGAENKVVPIIDFSGSVQYMARWKNECLAIVADNGKGGSDLIMMDYNGRKKTVTIKERACVLSFAPDGRYLCYGCANGKVGKLDRDGKIIGQLTTIDDLKQIDFISVTMNDEVVTAQSGVNKMVVLSPDGTQSVLTANTQPITRMAVSEDGMHLLVGLNDGSVRYWSTESGLKS